jgi:hypothetical protein
MLWRPDCRCTRRSEFNTSVQFQDRHTFGASLSSNASRGITIECALLYHIDLVFWYWLPSVLSIDAIPRELSTCLTIISRIEQRETTHPEIHPSSHQPHLQFKASYDCHSLSLARLFEISSLSCALRTRSPMTPPLRRPQSQQLWLSVIKLNSNDAEPTAYLGPKFAKRRAVSDLLGFIADTARTVGSPEQIVECASNCWGRPVLETRRSRAWLI